MGQGKKAWMSFLNPLRKMGFALYLKPPFTKGVISVSAHCSAHTACNRVTINRSDLKSLVCTLGNRPKPLLNSQLLGLKNFVLSSFPPTAAMGIKAQLAQLFPCVPKQAAGWKVQCLRSCTDCSLQTCWEQSCCSGPAALLSLVQFPTLVLKLG